MPPQIWYNRRQLDGITPPRRRHSVLGLSAVASRRDGFGPSSGLSVAMFLMPAWAPQKCTPA